MSALGRICVGLTSRSNHLTNEVDKRSQGGAVKKGGWTTKA
jgi:hypothetical protein